MVSSFGLAALLLTPALLVAAACGGGDDDDDDSGGDDSSGSGSTSSAGGQGGSSSGDSKGKNLDIPKIRDGNFEAAKANIVVSGDRDFKLDMQGNGLATGGFALLTFVSSDVSVQLAFQSDSKDEAGGVSLSGKDLATAAAWGADCSVKVTDDDKELKGEFECKGIDGLQPGTVKGLKVTLKGTFSAPR